MTTEVNLMIFTMFRKGPLRFPVWECGGVKVEGGSKCNICGKFSKSETSNTSNLIHHILKSHKNTASAKELESKLESKKKAAAEKKEKRKNALKRNLPNLL